MILKYTLLAAIFVSSSHCANILGIIPTPSYSHQIAYTPLWKELSLRGHKVTVITTNPLNDPKLVNLTEIDMRFLYSYFTDISKLAEEKMNMWNMHSIFAELALVIEEAILSSPPVQELIHNKNTFDVVLVEFLYPEFMNFAKMYDCPSIIISSLDVFGPLHRAVGNQAYTSLHPEIGTPFTAPLSFKERIINTIYSWYVSYYYSYVSYPKRENLMRRHLNVTLNTDTLISEADMLFLNVNPAIHTVRAVGATTINIGGYRETLSSKSLPQDLQDFLDAATDGFIYFSLGSNVKSKELAGPTFTAIFETLKEIPFKVLWKFENDNLPGKSENIKIIKWAPQEKVLCTLGITQSQNAHPNIKLFITQGGLQSMEEGIYREVPFVVIPFFADQEQNARLMESKGIARIVQRKPSMNKEELKNAILEVIHNPRYKNSVKTLRRQVLDSPTSGLESAVWWTEYVIRHKGAKHLRNPAADLPLYQYFLLDVISFLVLATASALWVASFLMKKLYKLIWYEIEK
ncbi:hypothetical protein NQ318_021887 [Aromia moschata]|uniref:UDP-glucuronosyltransferase n=1 Tax=Aromia moschata TaxID=1265417 RepID=A0AAV8Z8X8_9CUCU|nr:hypothetical protein NQ318_021887 [Aromia moschata]